MHARATVPLTLALEVSCQLRHSCLCINRLFAQPPCHRIMRHYLLSKTLRHYHMEVLISLVRTRQFTTKHMIFNYQAVSDWGGSIASLDSVLSGSVYQVAHRFHLTWYWPHKWVLMLQLADFLGTVWSRPGKIFLFVRLPWSPWFLSIIIPKGFYLFRLVALLAHFYRLPSVSSSSSFVTWFSQFHSFCFSSTFLRGPHLRGSLVSTLLHEHSLGSSHLLEPSAFTWFLPTGTL